MRTVTRAMFLAALEALGIQPGDGLLVHSALQFLGKPQDGPEMYLHVLLSVLGSEGTLAVPAFTFAFAQGKPFDLQRTPSEGMGVFSELVRTHPQARRTSHPMQSLAVLGKHRDDLCGRDTPSAFDDGSAFDRMLELNFRLLLLGAEVQACSMVHYSEQRLGVPYRFWKDFTGTVTREGKPRTCTYRMYVRDMDIKPQLKLKPIEILLSQRGQWSSVPLNYGFISTCSLRNFVAATNDLLFSDPWALIENRPGQSD